MNAVLGKEIVHLGECGKEIVLLWKKNSTFRRGGKEIVLSWKRNSAFVEKK